MPTLIKIKSTTTKLLEEYEKRFSSAIVYESPNNISIDVLLDNIPLYSYIIDAINEELEQRSK